MIKQKNFLTKSSNSFGKKNLILFLHIMTIFCHLKLFQFRQLILALRLSIRVVKVLFFNKKERILWLNLNFFMKKSIFCVLHKKINQHPLRWLLLTFPNDKSRTLLLYCHKQKLKCYKLIFHCLPTLINFDSGDFDIIYTNTNSI